MRRRSKRRATTNGNPADLSKRKHDRRMHASHSVGQERTDAYLAAKLEVAHNDSDLSTSDDQDEENDE